MSNGTPSTTDLVSLPAREVLRLFSCRELSPVEYLETLIARIEAVGTTVNALGDTYFEEALAEARRAEKTYASAGAVPRPLEGLPVAVKDEVEIAGKRTTFGSLLFQDWVGSRNEPIVERLIEAGAIIHARTVTPEFSIAFWTHSRLWGVTRNPWNLDFDVGGSSGGSAAALAAGFTPLATGSDIGGSVRVPASCCGVVGFIGPHGRMPVAPPYNLDHWSNVGPLGRTVADCALMTDVIAGPHPRDHTSLPATAPLGVPEREIRGMRLAVSYDLGDWPVTEAVRVAVAGAVDGLRDAGATVEETGLVVERELVRTAGDAHHATIFARDCARAVAGRWDDVCAYTRSWLASLENPPDPLTGLEAEVEIMARVGSVLEEYDALLCPAIAVPAFAAGVDYTVEPFVLDGVELDTLHDVCPAEIFNVTSRCPVLAVPAGRDPVGVPIGLQIVGRPFDDPTVFRIGAALERERPWPLVADVG